MSIIDASFDREDELQKWTFEHIQQFLSGSILLPGFRITTPSGKHGIPDGFAFNFTTRQWWIVECELLSHGVWPHIAEQLTRFVVAGRNDTTLKIIRDKLFDAVTERDLVAEVATALKADSLRLFQKIELFIETVSPSLALFIDETNQDLTDFCNALDVPTETYRIKKFMVNGKPDYFSPDQHRPVAVTTPEESHESGASAFDVIEQLGGGELLNGRLKCYKLLSGRTVKVQNSKLHEKHQAYWYGINPSSYQSAKEVGCTHFVFVMGQEGFVDVPLATMDKFISTAYVTNNADGTVRHYHIHISPPPDVALKGYGNTEDVDISDQFSAWA